MKRWIRSAAFVTSAALAPCLVGCGAGDSTADTGKAEGEIRGGTDGTDPHESLAAMLGLGARLAVARARELAPFYDASPCHNATVAFAFTPIYYERGAIYTQPTPFGVQPICVDFINQPGTDSPSFHSADGAALHAAIALNLGVFGPSEGELGRTAMGFERGEVITGGLWNECEGEVERVCGKLSGDERADCDWTQGRACMSNVEQEIRAGVKSPKSARDLVTTAEFVLEIRAADPAVSDDYAKIVTFLEYRMNLGRMSPRPSYRNDEIVFGFERGYAAYNTRTGRFDGMNTTVNRGDSGDTGIILAP